MKTMKTRGIKAFFILLLFINNSYCMIVSSENNYKEVSYQNLLTAVSALITHLYHENIEAIPSYLENLPKDSLKKIFSIFQQIPYAPELILKNKCGAMESFIEHGLNINFLFQEKSLALLAGEIGCGESLKRLIKLGAGLSITNKKGRTPLEAYLEKKFQEHQDPDLEIFQTYINIRIQNRHTYYYQKQKENKQYLLPLYLQTNYNYEKEFPKVMCIHDKEFEKNDLEVGYIEYRASEGLILFFVSFKNHHNFLELLHTCEHEVTHIIQKLNGFALQKIKLNTTCSDYAKKYLKSLADIGLSNKHAHRYNIMIDNSFLAWIEYNRTEEDTNYINYKKEKEADAEGLRFMRFPDEYHQFLKQDISECTHEKSNEGYLNPHEKAKLLLTYFKMVQPKN